MLPLSAEDAARGLANQASFVNATLLAFLAACAILPGLLLTLVEASRRQRNGVAWSLGAALGGAAIFTAAHHLLDDVSVSEALFTFAPLTLAMVAGFIPALVLRGRPPVSSKRRWPVVPLSKDELIAGTLILERATLRLDVQGQTQRIGLGAVRAITANAATIVLTHRGSVATEELHLLPVAAEGEDEAILAQAIAERIRRAVARRDRRATS